MVAKANSEVKAMEAAWNALSGLQEDEQRRVLLWLIDKLKLSQLVSLGGASAANARTSQQGVAQSGSAPGTSVAAKQFLASKKPNTDAERMTCLAYFLTHHRDTPRFKTKELKALNSEAAGIPFSNATVAANNASLEHYLAPAGGGTKQITARGEAIVEALPDREAVNAAKEQNPARRRRHSKPKGKS